MQVLLWYCCLYKQCQADRFLNEIFFLESQEQDKIPNTDVQLLNRSPRKTLGD